MNAPKIPISLLMAVPVILLVGVGFALKMGDLGLIAFTLAGTLTVFWLLYLLWKSPK